MKDLIRIDLKYLVYSKLLLWICLGASLCIIVSMTMSYKFTKSSLDSYNNVYEYLVDIGADIETEKNTDYVVYSNGTIENPLSYDIEQVEDALFYIHPKNSLTMFGEVCTLFFPIFAFIVGILLVSYDEKNKTRKLKITNYGKIKYGCSKQLSGILSITIVLVFSFIVMLISSCIVYSIIKKNYSISMFIIRDLNLKKYLFQLVFTLISTVFYFELGYYICNIFHCYIFAVIFISLISFFLPALFKYDFINVKNTDRKSVV